MKRIIIIILALLSVIALAGCRNEPGEPQKTPVKQTVVRNDTEDIATWYWHFQNADSKYLLKLYKSEQDHTATLYVKTYDQVLDKWPDEWVVYTGTATGTQYDKLVSETEARKEVTGTWMYTVTFDTVSDPWYEPTVHVYDGVFDVSFVSGWNPDSKTSSGGQYYSVWTSAVIRFEISTNSDSAPSALIGVGDWTVGGI